jgi:hypothetical protein
MTVTMVFVHGRGQEFQDPAVLVRSWQAGLAAGLVKAGVAPLADAPAVFPYYGNLPYQITAQATTRLQPGPGSASTPAGTSLAVR